MKLRVAKPETGTPPYPFLITWRAPDVSRETTHYVTAPTCQGTNSLSP